VRIISLQRRLREIGRIRIGEKVEAKNQKGETVQRPAKLGTFRFTSRDHQVIDAVAALWDGTVEPWESPDGQQWQVTTGTAEIRVIVPPEDLSFSQSFEQWSAGGCQVRCDGNWDHIGDIACHCDPEQRACKIHTRLSVVVPDLPGIGVWRLESHGYNAAVELQGIVDLCTTKASMLPARLRLEQRSVKRVIKDKLTTLRFAVPVLDLDVNPMSLVAGAPAVGELPAPLTPVPQPTEAERALIPSVRDQITAVDTPASRDSRQATLPATGLKPRPAAQAQGSGGAGDREAPDNNQEPPPGVDKGDWDTPPEPATDDSDGVGAGAAPVHDVRAVAIKAGHVFRDAYENAPRGQKTKVVDQLRHALVYACTKGEHSSLNDLDTDQLAEVWVRLEDINAGRLKYRHDPDPAAGVTFISQSGKETTVLWADATAGPEDAP
jgi:hypothetical protein